MHGFLIVLYNTSLYDSLSFQSLLKIASRKNDAFTVYVWDNSEVAMHKSHKFVAEQGLNIIYFHEAHNINLSKIYNTVLDMALPSHEYITILDQDTVLDERFLDSIPKDNRVLVVPRVQSSLSKKMISPRWQYHYYFINHCKVKSEIDDFSSGIKKAEGFFSVGSGLTINNEIWNRGIRFNEGLSFYGVDTEFCNSYAKLYDDFLLLNSTFLHSPSNEEFEDYNVYKWRVGKYAEYWAYQLSTYTKINRSIIKILVRAFILSMIINKKIKMMVCKVL
ncbi:hypothetical protein AB4341_16650 [Vibrio breoganii]